LSNQIHRARDLQALPPIANTLDPVPLRAGTSLGLLAGSAKKKAIRQPFLCQDETLRKFLAALPP
jgi:hypothetical protein